MLSKRTHIAMAQTAAGPNDRPRDRLRAPVCLPFTQKLTGLEQSLRQPD